MPQRPEDDALLARLEDEALYERLVRFEVGAEVPAPSRAAGLLEALRGVGGADVAFAVATRSAAPRLDVLAGLTHPPSFVGYAPVLLHHLGIHHARLAGALEGHAPARALVHHEASLAAFFALLAHPSYLEGFVRRGLGPKASRDDVTRLAMSLPAEPLADLGRRAREGVLGLTPESRLALEVLARVRSALARAGAAQGLVASVASRADALRAEAIDLATERIGHALDDASTRGDLTTAGLEALRGIVAVWEHVGRDEAVERFFVERAEPVCWELQRRREWEGFARLFGTPDEVTRGGPTATFRLVESLVARTKRDRSNVAYAAACAQFLVFYTNVMPTFERQIAVAERAVDVCPTHRNGRAVLASYLAQKAKSLVQGFASDGDLRAAIALVERAESLFPSCRDAREARAAIEARKNGMLSRLP
jgi:hypothetical protein